MNQSPQEGIMLEDWLANAYEGMSRRQFMAGIGVASASLVGFAVAARPVAGEIISTATDNLTVRTAR